MSELRVGADLEHQVAARHHQAADELGELLTVPALGPGPGTGAMLRILAAVLDTSHQLAQASDLTADAVRDVAYVIRSTDTRVEEQFWAVGP